MTAPELSDITGPGPEPLIETTPNDELEAWAVEDLAWLYDKMVARNQAMAMQSQESWIRDNVIGFGWHRIPWAGLLDLVVDTAAWINPNQVAIWLQRIIGLPADGVFGPETAKRLTMCDPDQIYLMLLRHRMDHEHGRIQYLFPLTLAFLDRYVMEYHSQANRPFGQEPGFVETA